MQKGVKASQVKTVGNHILSTLSSVEKKTLHLTKLLGIKVKKRKK